MCRAPGRAGQGPPAPGSRRLARGCAGGGKGLFSASLRLARAPLAMMRRPGACQRRARRGRSDAPGPEACEVRSGGPGGRLDASGAGQIANGVGEVGGTCRRRRCAQRACVCARALGDGACGCACVSIIWWTMCGAATTRRASCALSPSRRSLLAAPTTGETLSRAPPPIKTPRRARQNPISHTCLDRDHLLIIAHRIDRGENRRTGTAKRHRVPACCRGSPRRATHSNGAQEEGAATARRGTG